MRGDVDPAVLLTSELVTNAVLHDRTALCVGVTLADRRAMISVADHVAAAPQPKPLSATRLGGRGLALVDALAEDWGAVTTEAGKVVWFTIPIAPSASGWPIRHRVRPHDPEDSSSPWCEKSSGS